MHELSPFVTSEPVAGGGELTRCEGIEIQTTPDALTEIVSAIPIYRTTLILIDTCRLMPECQCSSQRAIYRIDRQCSEACRLDHVCDVG